MLNVRGRMLGLALNSTLGVHKTARWLIGALLSAALLALAPAALADSSGATVTGTVEDASTMLPIGNVQVSASDTSGDSASAVTDSNGNFTLSLPPGTWTFLFTPSSAYQSQTLGPVALSAGENPGQGLVLLQPNLGNLTGRVTDGSGAALPGMQVQLTDPNGADGPAVFTGSDGTYTFMGVGAGTYSVTVFDGVSNTANLQSVQVGSVTVAPNGTTHDNLAMPSQVPRGTAALNSTRDLAWLNAERVANGLPGGIVMNPRWAADCAAHDAYERANGGTLTHHEQLGKRGSSTGGWWDGTASILADATSWAAGDNPFETGPLHLASLYAPSLSVVGIDEGHHYQCVNTMAGTQRTFPSDTVFTYPGNGVNRVPPSEDAAELPFVPGQFVGIPEGRTAGRELFVYLNQAGQMGQAQVRFLSATLSGPQGRVAIKTVDNATPTVGSYLDGGIIIPVKPLAPNKTYTASVTLADGSGPIRHTWSFTTGSNSTRSGVTGTGHKRHKRKPARHRKSSRH